MAALTGASSRFCPVADAGLWTDDPLGPSFILNLFGPSTILLSCLLVILKLTSIGNRAPYLAWIVMAYVLARLVLLGICPLALGQSSTIATTQTATSSDRAIFTVPFDADDGQPVLPNILDPEAVIVQDVCPGYTASNVQTSDTGLTANLDLAGAACNVYGNDIENLTLTVEFQDTDRLNIAIQPRYIGSENETWFILPEVIVPKPVSSGNASSSSSDFELAWTNDPTFQFTVTRKLTGDTLFTTNGSKLVYADQFIEFVSPLPENYNLYGLGETIHGFRLGNNLTRKYLCPSPLRGTAMN